MSMSVTESIVTIALVVIATMLTRFLPFMLFPAGRKAPTVIRYLGQVLPTAVIAMLVIYCLKDAVFSARHALPELIAIAFIVVLHKLFHSMMISVVGGTVGYMLLMQHVFVG